jgi:hypothetical protein
MVIWTGIASIIATAVAVTLWVGAPTAVAAQRQSGRAGEVVLAGCVQQESAFRVASGIGVVDTAAMADHLVLVGADGVAYSLMGTRERELRGRVGSRVEVTGTIEAPPREVVAERAPGLTPAGSPAHETADTAADTPVKAASPSAPDLARLNMRSFRTTTGTCPPLPAAPTRVGGTGSAPTAPAVAAETVTPTPQPTTVRGCLTVDPEAPQRFVLNDIRLDGIVSTLTPLKGTQVEVTGTLVEETATGTSGASNERAAASAPKDGARLPPPTPIAAHPSAARRMIVTAVRQLGGTCQ